MSNLVVTSPQRPYTFPDKFKAVSNGDVYAGLVDKDPEIPANQIQVYVVGEDGHETPVSQPLKINSGGLLVYNGQPAKFVVKQNYSMLVKQRGKQVMYEPKMAFVDPESLISVISDGDSQLTDGLIWPGSGQGLLTLGSQSSVINVSGVTRLRVDTGVEPYGELLYLWEPSGNFGSSTQTITNISKVDDNEYTVTALSGVYTFFRRPFTDTSVPYLSAMKHLRTNPKSGFVHVSGFASAADAGDCVWKHKGYDALKAGNSFSLSLMEAYDSYGNIYEPYGVFGSQKLEIKPEAIGAVGDFLNGSGTDNILILESLRDYLQSKNGGVFVLERFSFYGVSRSFLLGTSRTTSPDYLGTGQDCGFGKLNGFTAAPAATATRDSVVRMNCNDFTDSVGTFSNWDCSSFAVQAMDGSTDGVSGMSVVGAVRTSRVDNIRTDGGYDGIALTSCWSHIFTRNQSENAHNNNHVMGEGEYGEIIDVVVNAAEYHGNIGRGAGNWGLYYKFGSAVGLNGNTYELNDKNAWFQDVKSGEIANLYCEGALGTGGIELKIGGNNSEKGIVQYTNFTGIICAFGGKKVLVRGMQDCSLNEFRLDIATPITSDNASENRVVRNKFRNAVHDNTIDKSRNETDTFIKGSVSSASTLSRFAKENRTLCTDNVMTYVPASNTTIISSGFKGGTAKVIGHLAADDAVMFIDYVDFIAFGTAAAKERNKRGSTLPRRYSVSGSDLKVNIAADYTVFVIVDGVRFI